MTGARPRVVITFCSDCGYEAETLSLAGALLRTFGGQLEGVQLVPWDEGTFEVLVEDDLVHSMARDGGFADHERVKQAVRAKIGG